MLPSLAPYSLFSVLPHCDVPVISLPFCTGRSQTVQRLFRAPGKPLSDLFHNSMAAARKTRGSFRDNTRVGSPTATQDAGVCSAPGHQVFMESFRNEGSLPTYFHLDLGSWWHWTLWDQKAVLGTVMLSLFYNLSTWEVEAG